MTAVRRMFDLSGRKAVVTGAAMGIGRASALALARAGADVAIVDLNENGGRDTVAAIEEIGRNAVFIRADVTDPDSVQAMVATCVRKLGRLDIAVNNAGVFRPGRDEEHTKDDWDHVIRVNLTGVWLCARAEMQQMREQTPIEGKIINVASIAAFIGMSNGAYDASKAGVVHLTRTLAVQWGRYNINVNCISPGYVGAVFGMTRSPHTRERLRQVTPLGYVQRHDDLIGPIVFLASAASDYVTGQNIVVDGGHTLSTWVTPLDRAIPPRVIDKDEG
jgi:sorbose reductase